MCAQRYILLTVSAILLPAAVSCDKNTPAEAPAQEMSADEQAMEAAPAEVQASADIAASAEKAMTTAEEIVSSAVPDFTLRDHNNQPVTLSSLAGKTVVLEWLNYDCPFVKPHYEKGTFAELAERYADKDVVWLAINSTNYATIESNKAFAEKHELPYVILDDHEGKVGRLFGATNTPQIIIISKACAIVYNGAIDNAPGGNLAEGQEYVNYADKALAELTSGKEVSLAQTKPYGCTVKYAN